MSRPPSERRPRREPQALADLLPRVLDELGLGSASRTTRLLRVWSDAVGPELAAHCRPRGIERGVVLASVPDSGWMQRVQLQKSALLQRLRAALDDEPLTDLRLRVEAMPGPSSHNALHRSGEPERSERSERSEQLARGHEGRAAGHAPEPRSTARGARDPSRSSD